MCAHCAVRDGCLTPTRCRCDQVDGGWYKGAASLHSRDQKHREEAAARAARLSQVRDDDDEQEEQEDELTIRRLIYYIAPAHTHPQMRLPGVLVR
jgi:hypothetical protein